MKRRLVAVTLSLVMTMATVSEASAAAFTSPDCGSVVETSVESTQDVENTAEQTETEDVFSSGDDEVTDATSQNVLDDTFSAGTDDTAGQIDEAPTVISDNTDATDTVIVNAEDWVSTENGFKLHKPIQQNTEAAQDIISDSDVSEEEPASDVNTVDAATADVTTEKEFYTSADGIVKICTQYKGDEHTGYYLFDENGILVTGQSEVQGDIAEAAAASDSETDSAEITDTQMEQVYFTTLGEAVVYAGCENEAITPYTSTVGQQQKDVWKWTGSVFQYYDVNGKLKTVEELETEAKANGTYTGYFKINDEYYCLDKNGMPRTGDITLVVNGVSNLYYFEETSTIPGRMFHEGWRRADDAKGERWLYYNKGVTKPENIGKYYERGITATVLGAEKGTAKYLIDSKGYILKSTMKQAANGAWYGTDKNGVIYKNTLVKFGNYRYYFGANGARASWTKRWAKVGNHYYYFGNVAGRVAEKHGWQKISNTKGKFIGWFYFDSNGNHYTDKWSSEGYYFTPSGKLASGLVEINGRSYLFEASSSTQRKGKVYKSTMVRYKNKWYIASSTGGLYKSGWRKYSGNYYYLKDYVVQTNQFMKKNGVNGYLDANGKYTTGWVVVSNAKNLVRYIDPTGNGFAKNKSIRVNGILYYFDKNGYRITDLTSRYTGPYTVQVDRVNGVMTIYADSARTIPVKTIRVSVGLPGTPTPTGRYTLSRSSRWQQLMGPSWGQYGTHVDGAGQGGIFVHSVACGQANSFNLPAGEYNKLGSPASHGCIRVCVADAKWVYEHCNGSTIYILDGAYKADDALKGALGKKPLTPLRGARNFDPTDPAVK